MTKIYGIYGYVSATLRIPIGDGSAYLIREFTKGNPKGTGAYYKPATFVSCDRTEQEMIENSPLFNNTIQLIRSFEDEGDVQEAENMEKETVQQKPARKKSPAVAATVTEYPEVTTIAEVRAIAKSLGAKAPVLASEELLKSYVEEKKLVFPNFSF